MIDDLHDFINARKLDNPFYDNHTFSKEDLKREKFDKRKWLWLWLFPTNVQISSDGYVFHFKIVNGAYYIIKAYPLHA